MGSSACTGTGFECWQCSLQQTEWLPSCSGQDGFRLLSLQAAVLKGRMSIADMPMPSSSLCTSICAAGRGPCAANVRLSGAVISMQQAAKMLSVHCSRKLAAPLHHAQVQLVGLCCRQGPTGQGPPAALPPNRMSCPSMMTAEALHRGTGTVPSVTALCHVHVSVSRKCTSLRRLFSWLRPPKMTSLHIGSVFIQTLYPLAIPLKKVQSTPAWASSRRAEHQTMLSAPVILGWLHCTDALMGVWQQRNLLICGARLRASLLTGQTLPMQAEISA